MNEQVYVLLEKARASLQASEILSREGYPDFVASRAYYAMFYAAEALLLARGLSFSSHSAVMAAFGKEFARTKTLDPKFHRYLVDAQDFVISVIMALDHRFRSLKVRKSCVGHMNSSRLPKITL